MKAFPASDQNLTHHIPFALAVTSATLIAATTLLRFSLLRSRTFDPDEFQHLHAAWAMHQGLWPYRDFFEHHMPTLQFGLAQLMSSMGDGADAAIRVAFMARGVMWILAAIAVLLTMWLGSVFGGAAVAWISGVLLSTSVVFVGRTMEIRPDVPSLVCWVAATLAWTRACRPAASDRSRRAGFAIAGLFLGCGLAFNQKLLLAGPGIAAFSLVYLVRSSKPVAAILDLFVCAAGVVAPLFVLAAVFWRQGALPDLVQGTFLNNLGWAREVSPVSTLKWMLLRDPLFSALGVAGIVHGTFELIRTKGSPSLAALILPTASLLAGLAVTPAPYPQYMLLVLPAGAVLGANVLWKALTSAAGGDRGLDARRALVTLSGLAVAGVGLTVARPFFVHPLVYPVFALAVLAGTIAYTIRNRPAWAAALLLAAGCTYGFQQLRWMQGLSNAEALAEMRLVGSSTKPQDTVLDGFTGVAWFRPHALRYPFFHSGVRARLTPADVDRLVAVVESCPSRPRVVILDHDLLEVSPILAPDVARYYQPSRYPSIWVRKDPCVS